MEIKAFITRLLDKKGTEIHGRVQLQKLVYFCKAFGADIDVNYKLYIYGPYSQQVANALQDCVLDDILIESDGSIGKGSKFTSFLQDSAKSEETFSSQTEDIVNDILALCEGFSTRQLEIIATTFFINRQQSVLFGADDKEAVLSKVTRAKGSRFTMEEIEDSYQRVQSDFLPLEKKYAVSA